jgi:hypothetical protein
MAFLEQARRCRRCGQSSSLSDHTGLLHPCCRPWSAKLATSKPSPGCEASQAGRLSRPK